MKRMIVLFVLVVIGIAGVFVQQGTVDQGRETKASTEPAIMLLFGAGLIGLAGIRLKGKK